MAFIYRADIWCHDCGLALCERLTREGKAPSDPNDESTYDSDDFPKPASDDDECDCPQHCAAGSDCVNAVTLPSGHKIGALIGGLTAAGIEYVQEEIVAGGEVSLYWCDEFTARGYDFKRGSMEELETSILMLSRAELAGLHRYVSTLLRRR